MRQACFPPGVQKTWRFFSAAARIIARALPGDWGAAEISTDSVTAEMASRFSALDLEGERFAAGGDAGAEPDDASLSPEGAGTEPPTRKRGAEGGGGGHAGASARDPAARPATLRVDSASSFFCAEAPPLPPILRPICCSCFCWLKKGPRAAV